MTDVSASTPLLFPHPLRKTLSRDHLSSLQDCLVSEGTEYASRAHLGLAIDPRFSHMSRPRVLSHQARDSRSAQAA
jgi:hypothetical protein